VHHRRKLCDLQFHLEKAVNDFGAGCLPYPGKNSTISNIIRWFDNEIKALLATIVKVNKNFVCYAFVGVLRMLYDNSCDHIEGLQSIMASCDSSILQDLPEELTKLMGQLLKKWWTEQGMPDVMNHFHKKPVMRMFSTCCNVLTFCVDIHLCFFWVVNEDGGGTT
jgi:hypothetical protein